MRYRHLGNTSVRVSEIGFGTWNYRGGVEPLRRAIALGATLIDTAESYGTEEVVGAAIKGVRQHVIVATKVSPKNFRRADLIIAAEQSLKRLQTDYIDIYQLHWPNYRVPLEETLSAMEVLTDAGKVRFIGVSKFFIADLRRAQKAIQRHKIITNQMRYNLVERTGDPELFDYCEKEQITIITFTPLGQSVSYLKANDPTNVLGQIAAETGKTIAQVALNWCIRKPGRIALVKANSNEHVIEDCGASGWRLATEQVKLLEKHIRFKKRNPIEMRSRRFILRFAQMVGRRLELVPPCRIQPSGFFPETKLQVKSLEEIHGKQVC